MEDPRIFISVYVNICAFHFGNADTRISALQKYIFKQKVCVCVCVCVCGGGGGGGGGGGIDTCIYRNNLTVCNRILVDIAVFISFFKEIYSNKGQICIGWKRVDFGNGGSAYIHLGLRKYMCVPFWKCRYKNKCISKINFQTNSTVHH